MTKPHLLDKILNIRIGWLIEAMRVALSVRKPETDIFELSPSEIIAFLEEILAESYEPKIHSTPAEWSYRK